MINNELMNTLPPSSYGTVDEFINKPENKNRILNRLNFPGLYNDWIEKYFSMSPLSEYFYDSGIQPTDFLKVVPARFLSWTGNINSIIIKENIIEINESAFDNVERISSVEIKSESIILNNGSFKKCEINELVIPEKFKKRIKSIFKNCKIEKIKYTNMMT